MTFATCFGTHAIANGATLLSRGCVYFCVKTHYLLYQTAPVLLEVWTSGTTRDYTQLRPARIDAKVTVF